MKKKITNKKKPKPGAFRSRVIIQGHGRWCLTEKTKMLKRIHIFYMGKEYNS